MSNSKSPSPISENPKEFTAKELYAISLCVGWTLAQSLDNNPEDKHRYGYAQAAVEAFKRVYGESVGLSRLLQRLV